MGLYKQVIDITTTDLQKYPVWESVLEDLGIPEQDATTIQPYQSTPPDPHLRILYVRSTFSLKNGKKFTGIIVPIYLVEKTRWVEPIVPVDHSPIIVTDKGKVFFHYGTRKPTVEEVAQNYRLLGSSSRDVFPVLYVSDIEIRDCILGGVINGFMYFDESKKGFNQIKDLKPTDIKIVT